MHGLSEFEFGCDHSLIVDKWGENLMGEAGRCTYLAIAPLARVGDLLDAFGSRFRGDDRKKVGSLGKWVLEAENCSVRRHTLRAF